MKFVYLNESSMGAMAAMLNKVQKNAKVRLLSVNDLLAAATKAEKQLDDYKLLKRLRVETRCILDVPLMPKAYRYQSESTAAILVRKPKGWVLTDVKRVASWPVAYGKERENRLILTRAAHDYILENGPHAARVKELVANAYNKGFQIAKNQFQREGTV